MRAVGTIDAGVMIEIAGVAIARKRALPAAGAVAAIDCSGGAADRAPCWAGNSSSLAVRRVGFATGSGHRGVTAAAGTDTAVTARGHASASGSADGTAGGIAPGMVVG